MAIHNLHKRHVRFLGKPRVRFDARADRPPIQREVVHEDRALWIPYVHNRHRQIQQRAAQFFHHRPSHVHLEKILVAVPLHQPDFLPPGAGKNRHRGFGKARLNQESRRAARAVSG